jgi:hypothetical protein
MARCASEHTHTRAELDAQREMHRAKAEERDELGGVDERQTFVREATSAPRRKPTASDGRPTVCPTKPTCPEHRQHRS